MSKMVSLAQTFDDSCRGPVGEKSAPYFPSLWLDQKLIPKLGLENAKVGAELVLVTKVRIVSSGESEQRQPDGTTKKTQSITLDMIEARTQEVETDLVKTLYGDG